MAITYANYFYGYTYTEEGPFADEHVLLYDVVLERRGNNILDRWRALDPSLRGASCVIIRGQTTHFLEALRSDTLFWSAAHGVPIAALVGGLAEGRIELVRTEPFHEANFPISVDALRAYEIRSIIGRNGALYGPHDDSHYELPSGDHAEAFVRLGTALQDPVEVSRISDWVLPHLRQNSGVIADTGGLLPLVATVCHEARKLYGWHIPLRTIASYPADPTEIRSVVNDLYRELGPGGHVLFLVSVSSSGRLVRQALNFLLPGSHSTLIVCDTARESSGSALLHFPIKRWNVDVNGKCETCDKKQLYFIDHRTYERVLSLKRVPVAIKWNAASAHREFWEAADRTTAIRLHHDLVLEDGTQRHYGIYIDLIALLRDKWFRARVIEALRSNGRPTIALIPLHGASSAVREVLLEAFGSVNVAVVAAGQFPEDLTDRLRLLREEDSVLVLDDGLVSGTTLNNFRPYLHRAYKDRDAMPTIKAFVIVSRPSRHRTVSNMRSRYRDASGVQFSSAYQIYLPDYRECPWCRERVQLRGALHTLNGSGLEFASKRIEQLTGSLREPFLLGGEAPDAGARSVGSFFGTLHQSTGFAAAVSAIHEQWLDAAGDQDEYGDSTTKVYYVDVQKLLNNYFADAFAPAVLRTMKQKQLMYQGQNSAILDAIDMLDPQRAFPCMVPELLWAVVEGKLPHLAGTKLLKKIPGVTPEIDMLRQLTSAV